MHHSLGKIYLIPSLLGNKNLDLLSKHQISCTHQLKHFIAEKEKTLRAFLALIKHPLHQDELVIEEFSKKNQLDNINEYLEPCYNGFNIGLVSEAGMPCLADPGYEIVRLAHETGIDVGPLGGLNSMMMALSASGMNAQSFCFHGYLPIKSPALDHKIKFLFDEAKKGQTQVFMETPYRNTKLLDILLKKIPKQLRLCVACDLTLPSEAIFYAEQGNNSQNLPDIHKKPAVFVLGK